MQRIGLSGTNWTGKSTTVGVFVQEHPDLRIDVITLSDLLQECPFPLIEKQTPDASRWVLERLRKELQRSVSADAQMFDRSPVDLLAFTQYAFERVSSPVDARLMEDICNLTAQFDHLFFIKTSDTWPLGAAPRLKEIEFAQLMEKYLVDVIREYQLAVEALPWEMSDRQRVLSESVELPADP